MGLVLAGSEKLSQKGIGQKPWQEKLLSGLHCCFWYVLSWLTDGPHPCVHAVPPSASGFR